MLSLSDVNRWHHYTKGHAHKQNLWDMHITLFKIWLTFDEDLRV